MFLFLGQQLFVVVVRIRFARKAGDGEKAVMAVNVDKNTNDAVASIFMWTTVVILIV